MIRFLIIACFIVLLTGCKSETKEVNSTQDSNIETISIVDTLSLKLNASKKWIANIETHEGITKMDAIIKAFKTEHKTDYQTLGNDLSKQTGYIIENCSMKGEPHDQLHLVLIPMLDEISVLREENDPKKTILALHNLKQLISAYFKFFEV